jgi:hypothetical protein
VALAGVDLHFIIGIFAIAVDNVFAAECVVLFERFVFSKAVEINNQRLLLAVGKQESICRFVCGYRRYYVPLSGSAIGDDEYGWLVATI